jgi:hypothetical protein
VFVFVARFSGFELEIARPVCCVVAAAPKQGLFGAARLLRSLAQPIMVWVKNSPACDAGLSR